MGKDEETEFKKPELLDDILQETEELIKIFVRSIKTAEKKPRLGVVECSVLGVCFFIRCWTFDVRCWTFIFQNNPVGINATCECLQNNLALMRPMPPSAHNESPFGKRALQWNRLCRFELKYYKTGLYGK